MVLLRNDGLLPVDAGLLNNVAVVGPLAAVANLGDRGSQRCAPHARPGDAASRH